MFSYNTSYLQSKQWASTLYRKVDWWWCMHVWMSECCTCDVTYIIILGGRPFERFIYRTQEFVIIEYFLYKIFLHGVWNLNNICPIFKFCKFWYIFDSFELVRSENTENTDIKETLEICFNGSHHQQLYDWQEQGRLRVRGSKSKSKRQGNQEQV